MEALVFVKQLHAQSYEGLGPKKFTSLPRVDEYISVQAEGGKRFFQVLAIHHATHPDNSIELYAVQAEPVWEIKKHGNIGFTF